MGSSRPEPSTVEGERLLLSEVLTRPEVFDDVFPHVRPDDWTTPWMRDVAIQVWAMAAEGLTLEAGAVAARAKQHALAVLELVETTPACYEVEQVAKDVGALGRARRLAEVCRTVARESARQTSAETVGAWMADAERRLGDAVTDTGSVVDTIALLSTVVREDLVPRLTDPGILAARTVPSGLFELDRASPMQRGQLYTLAGTTGSGKSALACALAASVAVGGGAVVYLSLEMPRDQLAARMASALSNVATTSLTTAGARMDPEEADRLTEAFRDMAKWPIAIDERSDQEPASARSAIRRAFAKLRREHPDAKPSLIIIDHIHLMRDSSADKRSREQEIARISNMSRRLARDWDCPVVQLAQLSRTVVREGGKQGKPRSPQLSDLRDSGAIEQDSFAVWMLEMLSDDRSSVRLNIRKNRGGRLSGVDLMFDGARSKFTGSNVPMRAVANEAYGHFESGEQWYDG